MRPAQKNIPAPLSAAEEYFFEVKEAFEQACLKQGRRQQSFAIGPLKLTLHFVGNALEEALCRAMAHIKSDSGCAEELNVYCWDSESTGVPVPKPPWPATAYGQKGHINGYNTSPMHSLYQPGTDILNLYHRGLNEAVYWVEKRATIPYWECSFPMRGILHWWSLGKPYQLMHAGAVGFEYGGVLLAGKSGSGKSSTALACLNSDLFYASDDYVMMGFEGPTVHSVYATAKLVPDNLARFPEFQEKLANKETYQQEKAMFYLPELMPEKLLVQFPLRAIFLPRVTGKNDTSLSPATSAEALFALAPTTVLHLEGGSKEAFEKISALTRGVPCHWLNLGTDMAQIPDVIANYLDESRR